MAEAMGDYEMTDGSDAESRRRPLGSLLTGAGLLTGAQLEEALQEGSATGARLGEVVVRRGWATEDDVAKLLAEQWQLGYVERGSIFFDSDALGRMSRAEAQRLEALPTRVEDGRVVVAVAEPTEQRLADLRAVIGADTVVVVVPKTALEAGLRSELLTGRRDDTTDDERAGRREPPSAPAPPPAGLAARPAPDPTAEAPVLARVTPMPERGSRTHAPAGRVQEPELDAVLVALAAAAAEAAALGASMGELAGRLAELAQQATAATERLLGTADTRRDDRGTIDRLEQQLSQRHEQTESLKQQLASLTRTLENL